MAPIIEGLLRITDLVWNCGILEAAPADYSNRLGPIYIILLSHLAF